MPLPIDSTKRPNPAMPPLLMMLSTDADRCSVQIVDRKPEGPPRPAASASSLHLLREMANEQCGKSGDLPRTMRIRSDRNALAAMGELRSGPPAPENCRDDHRAE
jgi:hypothetical protein